MTVFATLTPGLIEAGSRLFDHIILDISEREHVKRLLLQAEDQQALAEM